MDLDSIIKWILRNPDSYPGAHLRAQPRTNPAFKPLEPTSQFHIIWKSTVEYLQEKLLEGKGINLRGFGAFTFDVTTDMPRTHTINPEFEIADQRMERKHLHKNRPCFAVDQEFKYVLQRFPGKEQLERPASQHSVYQRGFQMIFCNPVPIAHSCYLGKNIVQDAHRAIFKAVRDLTNQGRNLELRFNFCVIRVLNRSLSVQFNPNFTQSINDKGYELKMRKSDNPCKELASTTHDQQWKKSVMSNLMRRPCTTAVQGMNEKTLALRVLSLDMASAAPRVRNISQGSMGSRGIPNRRTSAY